MYKNFRIWRCSSTKISEFEDAVLHRTDTIGNKEIDYSCGICPTKNNCKSILY
jgi:hypothetical protein